jgi:predicted HNH restriction endonuclease
VYNKKHEISVSAVESPKEYHRLYRALNKERIREYERSPPRLIAQMNRSRKKKIKLIEYLGGACTKCGLKYNGENACIFDFHHSDDSKKTFNLAPFTRKDEDLLEESKKCLLVCANCHRMLHKDTRV